jgi:hypothetical protein
MPEAIEDPTFYFALGPRVGLPDGELNFCEHTDHYAVWLIIFPAEEVVIVATLTQSNADFMTFSRTVRRLVSSELGALPNPRCFASVMIIGRDLIRFFTPIPNIAIFCSSY